MLGCIGVAAPGDYCAARRDLRELPAAISITTRSAKGDLDPARLSSGALLFIGDGHALMADANRLAPGSKRRWTSSFP